MLNKKVIIIGGGYSIKDGITKCLWDKIQGQDVWVLNFGFLFMPFAPSRLLWCDRSFFIKCCKEIQMLYHEKNVDLYCKDEDLYKLYDNENIKINRLKVYRLGDKESDDALFLGRGGLVGFLALSLALREKYDEIYLLGYDFGTFGLEDKNTHWYQEEIKNTKFSDASGGVGKPSVYLSIKNNSVKPSVLDFNKYLDYKDKIFNVSSFCDNRFRTNISQFPILNYEEFFDRIKNND
jgi:hypothetical protein